MQELKKFLALFVYLALLLTAFRAYTELTLAEYHITGAVYGYIVIEALVLAKVLTIGDFFRIGGRLANAPLIVNVFYRTSVFILFVGIFAFFEHFVEGLVHRESLQTIFEHIAARGKTQILARMMVLFVAIFPLVALQEVVLILGGNKIIDLLLKRAPKDPGGRR